MIVPVVSISAITIFLLIHSFTQPNAKKQYKGLVLFDVDKTLTSNNAQVNELIVQYCIDNNFAVGICTAGPVWTLNKLCNSSNEWMPRNLCDFILKHSNITFNNVGNHSVHGRILIGKTDIGEYSKLKIKTPGYLKAFALEKTANALGITDPKRMILCDNDKNFVNDARKYNPNLNIVCCSSECGGKNLNIVDVKKAINIY